MILYPLTYIFRVTDSNISTQERVEVVVTKMGEAPKPGKGGGKGKKGPGGKGDNKGKKGVAGKVSGSCFYRKILVML